MWWRFTLTSLACLMLCQAAQAQTLESALMPGAVIEGHAKFEAECANCHVRFDRGAQARLCLDCHKPVRADVNGRTGYHGRSAERGKNCRTCHTEHKGRTARIVNLDEKSFDHAQTDFALRGRHRQTECRSCHRGGEKHSQAPSDCASCHRKDDTHKGGLGARCENCHNEDSWKEGRFDHGKTKFPLRRSHAAPGVKCADCHVNQKYADTSRECVSCHRDDDMKTGHRGQLGNRCERCHSEGEWKSNAFNHDRDTRFPLLDRHRPVTCASCHRSTQFRDKTPTTCIACHRNDDAHKGALSENCDKCHNASGWKNAKFNHDKDTGFVLNGKHLSADCKACHVETAPADSKAAGRRDDAGKREDKREARRGKLSMACLSCHESDDLKRGHKGQFGEKCETCHNAAAFKPSLFDHGRQTPVALRGKHSRITCITCHRGPLYTQPVERACYACHKDQDVHFTTYGTECEKCHVDDDWRRIHYRDGLSASRRAPAMMTRWQRP